MLVTLLCAGVRRLCVGSHLLQLHSLHLNGYHITDVSLAWLRDAHSRTLYHLHLFDVGMSENGMAIIASMEGLETLVFDHIQQVGERGLEVFVEESVKYIKQKAEEEEDVRDQRMRLQLDYLPPPCPLSLHRLELHSCRLMVTPNSLLYLSLHPTLQQVELSGRCGGGGEAWNGGMQRMDWRSKDERVRRIYRQVEEMSGGRIRCNPTSRCPPPAVSPTLHSHQPPVSPSPSVSSVSLLPSLSIGAAPSRSPLSPAKSLSPPTHTVAS